MTAGSDAPDLRSIRDAELAPGDANRPIPRKRIVAWAAWDWATQPFNTVIITFVYTALYLTSDAFLRPEVAALGEGNPTYESAIDRLATNWGIAGAAAGAVVALLAPVLGQRSDARGRRKASLGASTLLLIASMLGLFWVDADYRLFWLGAGIVAFGSVVSEIAGVNYNAMLTQVSTPKTVGRISGIGWGMGYLGGIVALVIVVVADQSDWWGLDTDNGMAYRLIAVGCAVWAIAFGWAVFVFVPEAPARPDRPVVGFFQGYKVLVRDLKELWVDSRPTLWFLLASAVYRDGLAGVFAYGAIIAKVGFDFSDSGVIAFGIAANLVAGISTLVAGRYDDRMGPRSVIMASLGTIVVSGLVIVAFHTQGAVVFWIFGLALSACVGPAQAASRSLLSRVSPEGREAQIFGLYATTGRAASFMSPTMWWLFGTIFGAAIWGTLGVVLVVAAGMVFMVFVKVGGRAATVPADA